MRVGGKMGEFRVLETEGDVVEGFLKGLVKGIVGCGLWVYDMLCLMVFEVSLGPTWMCLCFEFRCDSKCSIRGSGILGAE